jgi:hypothetical protein
MVCSWDLFKDNAGRWKKSIAAREYYFPGS